MRKQKKEKKGRKQTLIKAIFLLISENRLLLFWLAFVLFFGFLGFWCKCLICGFSSGLPMLLENGDLYMSAVGILAPCICELLITLWKEKIEDGSSHFMNKRIPLVIIGIILCSFCPIIAVGAYKENYILQIILAFFVVIFSFLCFVSQFLSPSKFRDLDDGTFHAEQEEKAEKMSEAKKSISSINIFDKEVKL